MAAPLGESDRQDEIALGVTIRKDSGFFVTGRIFFGFCDLQQRAGFGDTGSRERRQQAAGGGTASVITSSTSIAHLDYPHD